MRVSMEIDVAGMRALNIAPIVIHNSRYLSWLMDIWPKNILIRRATYMMI